ncbi:Peptidase T [Raoultella terrigena]|uniref:Peptidase T n=1 Tax=Raoultella terrigena TaxID=577 RepID=A0A485BFE4_RAOTE|nr:Peptidase T [Raoultella terrigena]
MSSPLAERLTQRFFRYLAISSQSDPRATTLPTTPGQHEMARELAQELRQLGLDDIEIDEHATVTAVKRGNVPGGAADRLYHPYRYRRRRAIAGHPPADPAL